MTAALAVLAGSVPLLLLGLLFRELRKTPTPDPNDPTLRPLQRFGIEQTRAAAHMSSAMIRLGLVGMGLGAVGMIALVSAKSGALIGVLISVTTIPAAANVGSPSPTDRGRTRGGRRLNS